MTRAHPGGKEEDRGSWHTHADNSMFKGPEVGKGRCERGKEKAQEAGWRGEWGPGVF